MAYHSLLGDREARPAPAVTPHNTPPPSLSPSPTLGHSSDYGAWRLRAERAVDNANSMLDDENKLAPFFKEEPGLRQALAAPSDEDWERIKQERAEQKRLEQRRSRSQGISM